MLRVQKIYRRTSDENSGARTLARAKMGDSEIGFDSGDEIVVYSKGDILFYSYESTLPDKAEFEKLTTRKSFTVNHGDIQVSIPYKWFKEYCKGLTHVKVFYTKIGLFIKPYKD